MAHSRTRTCLEKKALDSQFKDVGESPPCKRRKIGTESAKLNRDCVQSVLEFVDRGGIEFAAVSKLWHTAVAAIQRNRVREWSGVPAEEVSALWHTEVQTKTVWTFKDKYPNGREPKHPNAPLLRRRKPKSHVLSARKKARWLNCTKKTLGL